MASKNPVHRAIKAAESVAGLARYLHVTPSTIRRWKTKLPEDKAPRVAEYLARDAKKAKRRKDDRNRFHELMKLAGEIGKLPNVRSGSKPRTGKRTIGVQHVKRFAVMLSLDVLDDIDVWLKTIRKKFPKWQMMAMISQYGLGEHRGYKTVYYQLAPDAGDFAISANVPTPRCDTLKEAASALREKLEEVIEGSKVLAFLHSVTVFNYTMRTPEEISARETMRRRGREKKRMAWETQEKRKTKAAATPHSTERPQAMGWGLHTKAYEEARTRLHSNPPSSPSVLSSKAKAKSAPKKSKPPSASKVSRTSTAKPKKSQPSSSKATAPKRTSKTQTLPSLKRSLRTPMVKTSKRSSAKSKPKSRKAKR